MAPTITTSHLSTPVCRLDYCNHIKVVEVPGEDHWWPEVLKSSQVLDFLESLPGVKPESKIERTVLVTYNPSESGSKNGFRIISQREHGQ
jgi:hypothetical protein